MPEQPSEESLRAVYDMRGDEDRRSYEVWREATLGAWREQHGVAQAESAATRPSSYLRIGVTTWPNPNDPNEVQWRLRYGTPSKEDLLVAASAMHAYAHLIELPERRRNERVGQIRALVKRPAPTTGREADDE